MCITEKDPIAKLQLGESPIKNAPLVPLSNGESCIPQHYLLYQHDRVSVEKVVLDIEYSDDYPIFVGEAKQGIYIQVGIISRDNYPAKQDQNPEDTHLVKAIKGKHSANKLVYGRKWRVEPSLPTSEIIQTVFLALKTAKEHEIRELFRLKSNQSVTTPFNNHHDLPVLARLKEVFKQEESDNCELNVEQVTQVLSCIDYDNASFNLLHIEQRFNKQWIVDVQINPTENTYLAELLSNEVVFTLILPKLTINLLYQYLMADIISLSNAHVEEYFKYKDFNLYA